MRTSRGEVEAVHGEHRGLAGDGVGRYGGCGFRAEPEGLLRASRRRGREARRERRGEQPRADAPPAGRSGVSARGGWHLVSMAVNGSVTSPSTGLQRPQRAPPWRVEAVARRCEARRSESPTQNARAGLPGVAVVARGKKGIAPKRRVQTNVRLRRREQHSVPKRTSASEPPGCRFPKNEKRKTRVVVVHNRAPPICITGSWWPCPAGPWTPPPPPARRRSPPGRSGAACSLCPT